MQSERKFLEETALRTSCMVSRVLQGTDTYKVTGYGILQFYQTLPKMLRREAEWLQKTSALSQLHLHTLQQDTVIAFIRPSFKKCNEETNRATLAHWMWDFFSVYFYLPRDLSALHFQLCNNCFQATPNRRFFATSLCVTVKDFSYFLKPADKLSNISSLFHLYLICISCFLLSWCILFCDLPTFSKKSKQVSACV